MIRKFFCKKRALTAFCISLALGCAAVLSGCRAPSGQSSATGPQRYSYTCWDVFDTVTSVVGYAETQAEWDAQMQALHDDLMEYHRLYDIYNTYDGITNLASLNAAAGKGPVQVDERIYALLQMGKTMGETTNGKMNVAAGEVFSLWHDARTAGIEHPETAALPEDAALSAAAEHCNLNDLILNAENGVYTAELRDEAMRLDVGSVGKGYAVEMCARNAEARGLASASISVGGNVRAIGTKPDGAAWTAGIEDPFGAVGNVAGVSANGGILAAVNTADGESLVTSGDYQRYFTVDGFNYAHLIDLDTNYPATFFRSVSVLTNDTEEGLAGRADALSTALFCLPLSEGQSLIESLPNAEACWVLPDKTIVYSSGFEAHLRS